MTIYKKNGNRTKKFITRIFRLFSTPQSLHSISTPDSSLNDSDEVSPTFPRHKVAAMPRLSISTEDETTLSIPVNKGDYLGY